MTNITRYPTPAPSGGDVDGPSSATDNALARYDGTTGKLIQDSLLTVSDAGKLNTVASASGGAGLNIPHGTAPSSPTNGDMWTTNSGVYARINGVTQGPFESAAGTYQPASGDLTAIDALVGTSGFLKKTATDTWALDTSTYLTGNQTITLSGDATGSGTTAITVTVVDDGHSHTGSTISGLDAGDTTSGTFDIARIPTGTTGSTVALGNHTHSYLALSGGTLTGKLTTVTSGTGAASLNVPHGTAPTSPADGDVWSTTSGLYVRVNGVTIGPLASASGGATWGTITGTLSSQTDLNSALSAKAPTASPTFTGTVTATTIVPSSGYLSLNYGGGGFDAVRSGQLQVLRDGVGDWYTLFAAYGTAAEVAADTPRFLVYGLGAFEATYEGKIYGTGSAYLKIDGGAGSERQVQFQTAGSRRWTFGATNSAESGSNAGSNFSIARYTDAGAWIDNPFEINRNDGVASIKSIWLKTGGKIDNLPTPTSSTEAASKGYVDTALALKAPLASPTFTGDIVVRDAIYIQGATGGASEGGAELRAGGSTYTFAIAPRNSDATYATSSEFYYQATAYSGTGLWAFEAPLYVAGQTAGAGKYSQIDGVRIENVSSGWRQISTPGDNLRIYGGSTGSYIEFPYNGTSISIKAGKLNTVASSTSYASLNVPSGTAPTSPTDGDVWNTSSGLYYRNSSTTQHVPRVTVSSTAPGSPVDGDIWVDTSTPTWTAPTFQNSWANYGSEWNTAGYYKDANGVVHLRGLVKSGSIGAIFTLPAGYRPTATWLFICACNSSATPPGYARVDINISGSVSLNTYSSNSNNGWVSLDGITFATF